MSTTTTLKIVDINTDDPLRNPRWDVVDDLADSIRENGLRTPIAVRMVGRVPYLVAGLNRIEAMKKLGRETIEAIEIEDKRAAQLWRIDENLQRAELTVIERSELIEARLKLVKPRHGAEVSKGGRGKKGGKSEAARQARMSPRQYGRTEKIVGLSREAKEEAMRLGLENATDALILAADWGSTPELQVKALQNEYEHRQQREANKAKLKERKLLAATVAASPSPVRSVNTDIHCIIPVNDVASLADKAFALAEENNADAMRAGLREIAAALNELLRERCEARVAA